MQLSLSYGGLLTDVWLRVYVFLIWERREKERRNIKEIILHKPTYLISLPTYLLTPHLLAYVLHCFWRGNGYPNTVTRFVL